MNKCLLRLALIAIFFLLTSTLALAQGGRPLKAKGKPISKGDTFAVDSLPDVIMDGEISIESSQNGQATVKGMVPIFNNTPCVFCSKVISIKPNLTIPLSETESIKSGSSGIKLKRMKVKEGPKGFLVIEGDGTFITP